MNSIVEMGLIKVNFGVTIMIIAIVLSGKKGAILIKVFVESNVKFVYKREFETSRNSD